MDHSRALRASVAPLPRPRRRVTNCPGMPGTVPESGVCVPRPGQKQSGTIKCPGIGSTALIMLNELLPLARVGKGMKLTLSKPNSCQLHLFNN